MTQEDIRNIIKKGEGNRIEFKTAENSVPESFYKTVVSFSNTDGGTILLGVSDYGAVLGINEEITVNLQKDIISTLNSRDCINPPLYIQPAIVRLAEGTIMVIQVQASSQVHDHAGKIYIREFEIDIDISGNQVRVSELYLRKRNFFSEGQIYPHVRLSDFDQKLFEKARNLIRNFRSDHPWLLPDNEQMLRDSILWKKDFSTGQEGYTLAAVLIFGKDQTIQSILPAYKVEAIVRIRDKDRWDDRITLRTNLIDTYLELKKFINKHLPEKFYMESDQRIDLRDKIFREVIGNVIVHREYTNPLSTDLIISESEVLFTNPNRPLFHGPIDPVGFNPYPKNPNIRKFFTAFGWTDEIGSGIRNTNKYLPLYINGAKPLFIENDTFKTEIPLVFVTLADYAVYLTNWLGLPLSAEEQLNKGLKNVPLPSNLSGKNWEEVLLHLVPSWHKNGTQLLKESWPDNQYFTKKKKIQVPSRAKKSTQSVRKGAKHIVENIADNQGDIINRIKKVPSWDEKGTKLIQKKVLYLISVLALTAEPSRLSELMSIFDYKNEKSFRDKYILPLRQTGFINLTNPSIPTDPENKYVITEKGKAFLGGLLNYSDHLTMNAEH